jgi:excisionase family DNA binding protein
MSEFISPQKAADMLGVSPNTLRNWEVSGKLMSMKTMGGHRRYYLQAIENLKINTKHDIKEKQ